MRTTLVVDDDVLLAVTEIARRRGVPVGKALSDLAREALSRRDAAAMRGGAQLFPIQPGAGVVTLEIVNRLRDETP